MVFRPDTQGEGLNSVVRTLFFGLDTQGEGVRWSWVRTTGEEGEWGLGVIDDSSVCQLDPLFFHCPVNESCQCIDGSCQIIDWSCHC